MEPAIQGAPIHVPRQAISLTVAAHPGFERVIDTRRLFRKPEIRRANFSDTRIVTFCAYPSARAVYEREISKESTDSDRGVT